MHGTVKPGGLSWRSMTLRAGLVWLVLCAIFLVTKWKNIETGMTGDPDDTMRLVQVRDLLAGQGWFDAHQYRLMPPEGSVMHWSRLVDAPIALVILLLKPLFGQPMAETIAQAFVPLLTLGVIVQLTYRIAARFFDNETATIAALYCGLLPIVVNQIQPMRIDHHGWQIACMMLAVYGLLASSARRGGLIVGCALATGLSISLELLPFAAAMAGILFLRWMRDPEQRWWLAYMMAALAVWLGVLTAATRPWDLTQWCDAITPFHVVFFGIAAAGTWGIALQPRQSKVLVIGLFGVVMAVALGAFASLSPQCVGAPFGQLDPLVHDLWYANVLEGQPIWRQKFPAIATISAQSLLAIAVSAFFWRKGPQAQRQWWFDYTLLLLFTFASGVMVWRSTGFAQALCAVPLGWLAGVLLGKFRTGEKLPFRLASAVALICVLLPAIPIGSFDKFVLGGDKKTGGGKAIAASSCNLNNSAKLLRRFDGETILAPLDIGPAILKQTSNKVIATGHHRANLGIRDMLLAFTSPDDKARDIIRNNGISLVVICSDMIEPSNYRRKAPKGFMAHLLKNEIPVWLEPVDVKGPKVFHVWRVKDDSPPA